MHRCVLSGTPLRQGLQPQGLQPQDLQLRVSRWVFTCNMQSTWTFYSVLVLVEVTVHNSRISIVPHLSNFLVLAAPPTPRPPPPPTNIQFSGELGGEIEWYRGTAQGGKKFDILQCQNVIVDWTGVSRDGQPHSIWEFKSPEAYKKCDKSQATRLVAPATTASHVIGQMDTFDVKRRYFASLEGDDCTTGRMRFSIKVRPRLQHKFPGYECDGATPMKVKTTESLVECRRMCKRLQGCFAIQYNNNKRCRIYDKQPTRLVESNQGTTCEIAAQTCDTSSELSLFALNKKTPGADDSIIAG